MKKTNCVVSLILFSLMSSAQGTYYFSSVIEKTSKPDSVIVNLNNDVPPIIEISGEDSDNFSIISKNINEAKQLITKFRFEPHAKVSGIFKAKMSIKQESHELKSVQLVGLSIPALEGENEPSLAVVLKTLDLRINNGWSSLQNHVKPDLQGEEINTDLFRKAKNGLVKITPIARYSPPYAVPFGYYIHTDQGPNLKLVGVLADSKDFHEHQTLYPDIEKGKTSFDPHYQTFGFYVSSETHSSYTEDIWNIIRSPHHASHATRVFALKNNLGQLVENSYIVCFEEAKNGDYQDFVFLIENVIPINPEQNFESLLHGNNLDGWDIFLEEFGLNNDPNHMFTMTDGLLTVIGKDVGYIITEKSYENYHLKVDFKWGKDKWPPRRNNKRDSGICYHIPDEDENKVWPLSVECQIQEGDVGDFWLIGYNTVEVNGKQNQPKEYGTIAKFIDNEKPNGEWNTVEVLTYKGSCVHIVNGLVVNYGTNSTLRKGRILLQSEYAELFYKNVKIRQL